MASDRAQGIAVVPSADHLERDAILQSMLSHLSEFEGKYEPVNIQELKNSVVKKVLDAADDSQPDVVFDERAQLQGFLKAFQDTHAFKAQFKILDKATQEQIQAFLKKPEDFQDTDPWKATKERGGFKLPVPNPDVSQILNTGATSADAPGGIGKFFLNAFTKIVRPIILCSLNLRMSKAAKELERNQSRKYIGGPKIVEDEKSHKEMAVYSDLSFENWGGSVKNVPKYTFVPTTVLGIQNLVKYAKTNGLRVRCGGYRHSWSTSFSQDQEIFISLLPIVQVTMLPDPISIRPTGHSVPPTELNQIQLLPLTPEVPEGKRWCRVGVAATNEDFRRWTMDSKGGNGEWALPADVILVEVTMGGVNGPICHGAGASHETISDYVRIVEYVDANGVVRTVSDPQHLRAAAGCFGLLGIVTHITLELDAMTYAVMKPLKVPIAKAIPPLQKNDIPDALRLHDFKTISDDDLETWKEDFAKRAANDYYSEWFWFTYQKRAWVNTWKNTTDASNQAEYPSSEETFLQWLEGWLGEIVNETAFFQALPGAWQAQLLATLGMTALPPTNGEDKTPEFKTMLPNALHFRRGVQNMRVRDTEFQIPVPNLPNSEEPDWSVIQRAWWDAIKLVYELSGKKPPQGFFKRVAQIFKRSPVGDTRRTPMRLTLELRIMGGSKLHMAPQAGNKYTASIEVLTVPDAQNDGEWQDFMQQLIGKWMSYTDATGKKLNVRPHWAKEWESLKFGEAGKQIDAREYLRTISYKDAIPEFKETLATIGNEHGWTLKDIQARFSNELWDKIVYS